MKQTPSPLRWQGSARHVGMSAATLLLLVLLGAFAQSRFGQALLPHAFCLSTSPTLMGVHLVSDALIALAYLLIPWALLRFVRRRPDVPFGWIAWVFGAFIVSCGVTHLLHGITLYYPAYWYSGVAKVFTAIVSLATAALLYRITPHLVAMPSSEQLRVANESLQQEVQRRETLEEQLRASQQELQLLLSQATQSAQHERNQFHQLADNIAQLAWMTDAEGAIYWYNERWFTYTGSTMAEMKGWGWKSVHHPDHIERVVEKFKRHVESGEPWEDTFPLRGEDGHYRWFLSRAFPLRNAEGKVVRWFGTNTDITEQLRAQQVLREAAERKDEFIVTLAHELRNPLAPIRTSADVLANHPPAEGTYRKLIEIIRRQVTHMTRLIDDLLDTARIARHRLAINMEPVDVAAVVRSTAEDYAAAMQAAGIRCNVDAPGPILVNGDAERLVQAVANLLQNAIRYAPRSAVEIRAFTDAGARQAVVTVRDEGPGIRAELLPRLFQPFEQEAQDAARSQGGLGLGLALVRRLVELHGGTVTAQSEGEGRGSLFELRLPLLTPITAPR